LLFGRRQRSAGRQALSVVGLVLWVYAGWAAALPVQGQTTAKCPMAHKLTLEQAARNIEQKLPEQRTIELIRACHVSFSLDAPSLEKLVNAGMTDAEFNALNPETAAGLSVEQAHEEVKGLEAYVGKADPTLAAQRDADIQKIDAEYRADQAKAAKIDPKGEFESTADYNHRVEQSKAAVAELGRKHEAAIAQVKASYEAKARSKFRPFQARIEFLKQAHYATGAQAVYVGYDADTNRLTATLGGEEYWFDQMPAAEARQMKEDWKDVIVARAYDEDDLKTRVLRLAGISQTGYSRHAKEEETKTANRKLAASHVTNAREMYGAGDFDGALAELNTAKELDPENAEVPTLTAEVTKAKVDEAAKRQEEAGEGDWVDTRTSLMWTVKDNGESVNVTDSIAYCGSLRLGGYSDWRVPTIDELRGVYDTRSTRATPPLAHTVFLPVGQGRTMKIEKGTQWEYHIRNEITLTGEQIWSSTEDTEFPGKVGVGFNYHQGKLYREEAKSRTLFRTLCVRANEKQTHGLPAQREVTAGMPPKRLGKEATPSSSDVRQSCDTSTGSVKLTPSVPCAERDATIVAPGARLHHYNLVSIDTSGFPNGGTLRLEITNPSDSAIWASFDLFAANVRVAPQGGSDKPLIGRYDVPNGVSTSLAYRFKRGQTFIFGLEGNWGSPKGAQAVAHFRATVSP
jgi:hypothetical protein